MRFKAHKQEWFVNRVGEIVKRETVPGSKISAIPETMPLSFTIMSEQHAKAIYLFHKSNRINFLEA